jgi:hypothetical protein
MGIPVIGRRVGREGERLVRFMLSFIVETEGLLLKN